MPEELEPMSNPESSQLINDWLQSQNGRAKITEGSLPAWKRNGGICIDRAAVIALGERLGALGDEPLAYLPPRS